MAIMMAKCKYCATGGIFHSVDKNGLCNKCAYPVLSDIQQRARIIDDCVRLAQDGKTLATRLSRHELLIEQLQHLLAYEKKGINILSPEPSELIRRMQSYRVTIVDEEIEKIADKAKKKAELSSSVATKFNTLSKALLKVQEILGLEKRPINQHQTATELRLLMHKSKVEGFVTEARKAEFKGNVKKAIDQYQEALFYIKNDDIDDSLQVELITNIELKLQELTRETLSKPT